MSSFLYTVITISGNEKTDPLIVKKQVIKTFESLLYDSPALPYFIEFLQSVEEEHYAYCWLECEKFRLLASKYISKDATEMKNDATPSSNPSHLNETHSSNFSSLNSEKEFIIKSEKNAASQSHVQTLPDLVSNIPHNAQGTPLPSPEDLSSSISSLSVKNVQSFTKTIEPIDRNFENSSENQPVNSEIFYNTFESENSEISAESLLQLSTEICNTYLNRNSLKFISLPSFTQDELTSDVKEIYNSLLLFQGEIYKYLRDQ